MRAASDAGLFDEAIAREVLQAGSLNLLLAAGREAWTALRERIAAVLSAGFNFAGVNRDTLIVRASDARMVLPFHVGDYVDFYSSLEHATNLGRSFVRAVIR